MTTYRKKMIEVALPLDAINKASAREKNPFLKGHPRALHLWWARRPLAACRAVLFASLVDDPDSDPMFAGDKDIAASKRAELFNLIEDLVLWENSNNPRVINRARAEIARCVATQKIEEGIFKKDDKLTVTSPACRSRANREGEEKVAKVKVSAFEIRQMLANPEQVNAFLAEYAPPVFDPFCGGGSIPLEAQRLGLRAYGSDLNPVPVLITKALIEIPPKFAGLPPINPDWQKKSKEEKAATIWQGAQGLAEDVRYYGKWMRNEAEKRIGHLYPTVTITKDMAKDRPDVSQYVGKELTVVAWLWARTVASPNPASGGVHVPLLRSFWLSTKKGKEAYILPLIDRKSNTYRFEVVKGVPKADFDAKKGTVVRTGATCLLTGSPISFDHIRAEGKAGQMGIRLIGIVAEGNRCRIYLSPSNEHEAIALSAQPIGFPDTDLPKQALSMRVMLYGMDKHYKLFTSRQLLAITTFSTLVQEVHEKIKADAQVAQLMADGRSLNDEGTGHRAYADAIAIYLAFGISQLTRYSCSIWTFAKSGQA